MLSVPAGQDLRQEQEHKDRDPMVHCGIFNFLQLSQPTVIAKSHPHAKKSGCQQRKRESEIVGSHGELILRAAGVNAKCKKSSSRKTAAKCVTESIQEHSLDGGTLSTNRGSASSVTGSEDGSLPRESDVSGISPCDMEARRILQVRNTFVKLRNIDRKYTRCMLVDELHETGFGGAYNSIFFPFDSQSGENQGYAIINFVDKIMSAIFELCYEGKKMSRVKSHRRVSVVPASQFEVANCLGAQLASHISSQIEKTSFPGSPKPAAVSQQQQKQQQLLVLQQQLQQQQSSCFTQAPVQTSLSPSWNKKCFRFCPYCGSDVGTMQFFCPFCGEKLLL